MDFNRLKIILAGIILLGGIISGCNRSEITAPGENNGNYEKTGTITVETRLANTFAKEALEIYYYWNEEIADDLSKLDPATNSDPIATVEEIRYHDGENQIDKWTMLTDNMEEFTSSVQGVSTTYGFTPMVYYKNKEGNELIAAVAYVSEGGPAEEAGMKRGDLIEKINGEVLTTEIIWTSIIHRKSRFHYLNLQIM